MSLSDIEEKIGWMLKQHDGNLDEMHSWHEMFVQDMAELYKEIHADPAQIPGAHGPLVLELWNEWGGLELASGAVLEGKMFSDGAWTGIHHSKDGGPLDNATLRNVMLLYHKKWASRMYRVRSQNFIVDTTVKAVLCEHGFYFNLAGYNGEIALTKPQVAWRRCWWDSIGSQCIQIVGAESRPEETPEPEIDATPGGPLIVQDSLARNTGYNHGGNARASFAFSFFRSPNDVYIKNLEIDNSMQDESRGCLLVEGSPLAVPGAGHTVALDGCRFVMGKTDRPLAIIRDRKNVFIKNCHFEATGGQNEIVIEGCENVHVDNVSGNTAIKEK